MSDTVPHNIKDLPFSPTHQEALNTGFCIAALYFPIWTLVIWAHNISWLIVLGRNHFLSSQLEKLALSTFLWFWMNTFKLEAQDLWGAWGCEQGWRVRSGQQSAARAVPVLPGTPLCMYTECITHAYLLIDLSSFSLMFVCCSVSSCQADTTMTLYFWSSPKCWA